MLESMKINENMFNITHVCEHLFGQWKSGGKFQKTVCVTFVIFNQDIYLMSWLINNNRKETSYHTYLYFESSLYDMITIWAQYYTIFFHISGLCSQEEERLVRDLFRGYNKLIRPVQNMTQKVDVAFGLAFIQLINVVII